MRRQHLITGLILMGLILPLIPLTAIADTDPAAVESYIWEVLEEEGQATILVFLDQQADLQGISSIENREDRILTLRQRLVSTAEATQAGLRSYLDRQGIAYRSYWIRNMLMLEADAALVNALARRPEVARIDYYYPAYPDPVVVEEPTNEPQAVEWNIERVNADDVWAMGYTGAGAVVADLDTGVQWDHPALINSYRGNLGGGVYDHNYNWWDGPSGSPIPTDYGSHGTHTMGTIVGDDGGANQIGMAPDAHWIACAGLGPNVTPFGCFQFFLAPTDLNGQNPNPALAPHVINNSWSSQTDYHEVIHILYLAGIYYAKSAGNEGSGCSTITNPGQWPEVTATAAFAQGDTIASFSSRGPVQIGHDTVIKPDIAAPGVSVRSSIPGDGYGGMSGTSMACPHIAGAVALIISARPELAGEIDTIQHLLKRTAEPMVDLQCPPNDPSGVPNNVWGWGILNIHSAVLEAEAMGIGHLEGVVYENGGPALENVQMDIRETGTPWSWIPRYTNASGAYSYTLPAASYNLTATLYGYLPGTATLAIADGVTETHDLYLEPAPLWDVSGHVLEEGSGDPLAATIFFEDTPVTAETDPATGMYSVSVAQGAYWCRVSSPGHAGEERFLTIDAARTENYTLTSIYNYYLRSGDLPCGPTFEWIDATGGTPHNLGDDSATYLGFEGRTFTFYGNDYSGVYLGSNGLLTFGGAWSKWSGPIPDPEDPNNGIYAFATDLNPAGGAQGTIYHEWFGDLLVVEFYQVQHYPSGDPETFEMILDFASGAIYMQYLTVSDPSEAVVGVENIDGTEATQYAYADPADPHNDLAIAFYPMFSTPPGEQGSGELAGTVTLYGSGDPVPDALITAVAYGSHEAFTTTTDLNGNYSMALCVDYYSVTASLAGFFPVEVADVHIVSGTVTTLDFVLGMPDIALTPAAFDVSLGEGETITASLEVENTGDAPLTFTITEVPAVDWLLLDPMSGLVAPLDSAFITATFDARSLGSGIYTTTLEVESNDPDQPLLVVPVTVTVVPCDVVTETHMFWNPAQPGPDEVITFTASASGTAPIAYAWTFGDGGSASGAVVTHTYTATGYYTVTVTISNPCSQQELTDRINITAGWQIYLPLVYKGAGP